MLKLIYVFLRLPIVSTNIERFEAYTTGKFENLEFALTEHDNRIVLLRQQETIAELQRQLTKLVFSKADRSTILDLTEKLRAISSEKPDRTELEALSLPKESVLELQRQLSRLEFTKADRNSLSELAAQVSSGLEAKADRRQVSQFGNGR